MVVAVDDHTLLLELLFGKLCLELLNDCLKGIATSVLVGTSGSDLVDLVVELTLHTLTQLLVLLLSGVLTLDHLTDSLREL